MCIVTEAVAELLQDQEKSPIDYRRRDIADQGGARHSRHQLGNRSAVKTLRLVEQYNVGL